MKKTLLTILLAIALCGTASAAKKTKTTTTTTPEPAKQTAPVTIVDALAKLSGNLLADVKGKPTFAFMALTSDDGNALVENYVTDALTEAMFSTGKIKIVERASIEKIMTEQQFQSSALVNENTAVEIGNLSGADYVCYGTVKDLNGQITLNVRVVEVSTAELSAMSRDTVAKDEYLANVGFEKRTSSSTPATKKATTTKKVANNQWQTKSFRNDFDDYSQFTFLLKGNSEDYIVVGLKKADLSMNSVARVGFRWNESTDLRYGKSRLTYEIKSSDGKITTMTDNAYPDSKRDWKYSETNYIDTSYRLNESGKWLLDILLNNEVLTVRANNRVVKFQTAGLEEKIIEAGLTVQDFYNAYDNLEF